MQLHIKRPKRLRQPSDNHVKETLIKRGWFGVLAHLLIEAATKGKWPTIAYIFLNQIFSFIDVHFPSIKNFITWAISRIG